MPGFPAQVDAYLMSLVGISRKVSVKPHLSGSSAGYWPFQVTSQADAERQKGVLAAIVELELHQRIFETDWRIIPVARR